jgi:hypothetical protein
VDGRDKRDHDDRVKREPPSGPIGRNTANSLAYRNAPNALNRTAVGQPTPPKQPLRLRRPEARG